MTEEVFKIWEKIKGDVFEYLKNTDFLCLIAHGSFAEGTQNKNSDFDILVLCKEDVAERTEVITIKDIEVDFDFIHEKTVRSQVESLDELLMPGLIPPFAARLKNAVILVDREEKGKTLVDMAKQYRPPDDLMSHYTRRGLGYYYDAVGAMASGNYATSINMARLGAAIVQAGILLNLGDLYVDRKWLIELMKRKSIPQESFLKLMGLDEADKGQALQCIRELNNLISELQCLREKK
ncbi:MAG: nucleotidyltransferase domain-containing protein [Theionarchaea archaeon]|nr:nucleotidyltransferase domain-containing protein [Theionarchaea archaeon]